MLTNKQWKISLSLLLILMGAITARGLVTTTLSMAVAPPLPPASPEVNLELVEQIGGTSSAVAMAGDIAYLGVGPRLVALNLSAPGVPQVVGQSAVLEGVVQGLTLADGLAYIAAGNAGLRVLDLSDPANLREVGFIRTQREAQGVAVQGRLAYVAEGPGSLRVIDIADPTAPREVGWLEMPGAAHDVAVAAGHAYVAYDGGMRVVDISNPAQPRERGAVALPMVVDVAIADKYAYVAHNSGLAVVDISDPTNPRAVGSWALSAYYPAWAVAVAGSYAYVTTLVDEFDFCWGSLHTLDVSDPASPREVGSVGVAGCSVDHVVVANGLAYIAGWQGLNVLDIADAANPRPVGTFNTLGSVQDLAVADSYAYVTDTRETGLRILDVSNPAELHEVGAIAVRWAGGLTIENGYAYVPAWEDGFRIFDVSNPPAPREVPPLDPTALHGAAYEVAVIDHYAYVTVGDEGFRVVEVADSVNPRLVGTYDPEGFIRDVAVVNGYAYLAGEYYEGSAAKGILRVIEVTDPAGPKEVGSLVVPHEARSVTVRGDHAYVTTTKGLQVVDVTSPARLREVSQLELPGGIIDAAVVGSYVYVVSGEGGLQVLDAMDPARLRAVGAYDTPGNAWRVVIVGDYVYIADQTGGLLILRVANRQTAPATPAQSDLERAREALLAYFSLLHTGRYSEAVAYYGGSYDVLRGWNPTVAQDDYAALFENGCTINGLMCLELKTIALEEAMSSNEFKFVVEFMNDDGTLFVREPCCGTTETEMPSQSQFTYTVRKVINRFLVQELPVYVP